MTKITDRMRDAGAKAIEQLMRKDKWETRVSTEEFAVAAYEAMRAARWRQVAGPAVGSDIEERAEAFAKSYGKVVEARAKGPLKVDRDCTTGRAFLRPASVKERLRDLEEQVEMIRAHLVL